MKADVTEIKSSDMSELLSHYWDYKLEENKLTINLTDTEAEKNVKAAIADGATKAYYQADLDLYIDNVATGTSTAKPLTSRNFDGNTCNISQDVSSIAQTINTLTVSVSLVTTTKVGLKTTKKQLFAIIFLYILKRKTEKSQSILHTVQPQLRLWRTLMQIINLRIILRQEHSQILPASHLRRLLKSKRTY